MAIWKDIKHVRNPGISGSVKHMNRWQRVSNLGPLKSSSTACQVYQENVAFIAEILEFWTVIS